MIETKDRLDLLFEIYNNFIIGGNREKPINDYRELIESFVPADVSMLVDKLVSMEIPTEEIKAGINRLMDVLGPAIENHPYSPPPPESYLGCLLENNKILDEKLGAIQPLLKQLTESPEDLRIKEELIYAIRGLDKYRSYYEIKESILFPEIRRHISKHGCLSVMTSYHNEIKNKLGLALGLLASPALNLAEFNKLTNELLIIMYNVKFREERILYIIVQDSISESVLNSLYEESMEIGFPYFQPKEDVSKSRNQGEN